MKVHDELNMTEPQYDRQMKKIRDCVFLEIEEETEDGFLGQIKPEIMKVLLDNIPINEGMDEEVFTKVLSTSVIKLETHITAETTGINKKLVSVFVNDFITQVFASVFRLESHQEDGDDSDVNDMMYG
jgi:hypothetical protein